MLMQIPTLPKAGTTSFPALASAFLDLQPHARIQTAPKGSVIVREGEFADHSMLVVDGWMALSKSLPDGNTQIIDVMLPGDFALVGAVIAPFAACSFEALSDARFVNLKPEQANGPGPQMEGLRTLLAAMIVTTQARTAELLLRMGKSSAASRIAYALLELYIRLEAVKLTNGVRFDFPMTQHKFGEFVGLSNVHVCRTMRRFEREGIISYPDQTEIVLNQLDVLCDIAGIDLDRFKQEVLVRRPVEGLGSPRQG